MVTLEAIDFAYPGGGFRLRVPSLEVAAGEKVAIVGPSGTGKTTLLNMVAGLLRPDSGAVRVGETEVTALSDARRRSFRAREIGFIFQDFALLEYLTARENILYPYRISRGLTLTREVRARAEALAAACGLADKLARRPTQLSQGEQQRVAICRALITEPKLILSDEATGNLDPENKGLILDLLFERVEAVGAGLLAVTHDHDLLPRFDRVIDFATFREAA